MIELDVEIIAAARAIRPYLRELVGPEAAQVDYQLAGLLSSSTEVDDALRAIKAILWERPQTQEWVESFLLHGVPPALMRDEGSLPGRPGPVRARRFQCPQGDYDWFQRTVAQPLPRCPTHGLELLPAE